MQHNTYPPQTGISQQTKVKILSKSNLVNQLILLGLLTGIKDFLQDYG